MLGGSGRVDLHAQPRWPQLPSSSGLQAPQPRTCFRIHSVTGMTKSSAHLTVPNVPVGAHAISFLLLLAFHTALGFPQSSRSLLTAWSALTAASSTKVPATPPGLRLVCNRGLDPRPLPHQLPRTTPPFQLAPQHLPVQHPVESGLDPVSKLTALSPTSSAPADAALTPSSRSSCPPPSSPRPPLLQRRLFLTLATLSLLPPRLTPGPKASPKCPPS